MKKLLALTLMILLVVSMVACGGDKTTTTTTNNSGNNNPPAVESLKLGLGTTVAAASSKLEVTINYAAVLVDKDGKIVDCEIDTVVASAKATDGVLELPTEVLTKGEKGDAYNMKVASGIGKEWYEQVNALEDYCTGKTLAEVKGIAIGEDGKATDEAVKSFATMAISDLVNVIEVAYNNAKDLGSKTGDTLKIASQTSVASSKNAEEGANGSFAVATDICALTVKDGKVTASTIDSADVKVAFDVAGTVTVPTDLRTKGQKGHDYNMKVASGIGKEWFEQVEGFCAYLQGKTASEIAGIAMAEDGKTTDADLLTSATMAVAHFQTLVAKTLK